jgi:transcriptional regulator with XRE-family HTH domain
MALRRAPAPRYHRRVSEFSALHERLQNVTAHRSFRALADLTGQNPETVRRYMSGQAPSVEFLSALCVKLGVNAEWLLTGRGPARVDQIRAHALKDANAAELLQAMAATIERLAERIDRLEIYVQTLEATVRGAYAASTRAAAPGRNDHADGTAQPPAADAQGRARLIAVALAQRPRPDAG